MTKQRGRRSEHTDAMKAQAVLESRAPGNTVVNVAKKYGVSANTLQNWRRAYPQAGALSAPRITRAARATVALGADVGGLVQQLRQDLAQRNAENTILRQIIIEQELRFRGYGTLAAAPGAMIAPEAIQNGTASTLRATN